MCVKKVNRNLLIIITFILFSILSAIIVIHMHIFIGTYDTIFHTKMGVELKGALLHKQLLPLYALNNFHGSSIMSMYPYFCLLPLAFIFLFTSSIIGACGYFFMFITFISCIVSYYSSLRFSKNKYVSYVFALVYSLSPVLFMNFYSIGDFAITFAMAFLPLAIFGFIDILQNSQNYFKLLFGLVLMAQCELPVMLVIFITLFFWALCNFKEITKTKLFVFFKIIVLYLFLTSIIWVPLFNTIFTNKDNTVGHASLKSSVIGDFIISISLFAWIAIVAFLIYAVKYGDNDKRCKLLYQMFFISILIIIITSKIIPWNLISSFGIFKILRYFQYMSRFFIIPEILLSYIFAFLFIKVFLQHMNIIHKLESLFLVILSLSLVSQIYIFHKAYEPEFIKISHLNYNIANKYSDIQTHMIIENRWDPKLLYGYFPNNDYYPKTSNSVDNFINNNKATYNKGSLLISHINYNTFKFYNTHYINHLALPFLHYNNEHFNLSIDGHPINYSYDMHHRIVIYNTKPGVHYIKVDYTPNISLEIIKLVLLLCGILWIAYIIFHKYTIYILNQIFGDKF